LPLIDELKKNVYIKLCFLLTISKFADRCSLATLPLITNYNFFGICVGGSLATIAS